jgi:hypothetical protein
MSSRLEITWQCPRLVLLDTSQAVRSGRSTFNDRFPRCERRKWVDPGLSHSLHAGSLRAISILTPIPKTSPKNE